MHMYKPEKILWDDGANIFGKQLGQVVTGLPIWCFVAPGLALLTGCCFSVPRCDAELVPWVRDFPFSYMYIDSAE
jgi:hypothetical protein